MVDDIEYVYCFIAFLVHLFRALRKALIMGLCTNSSTHACLPPPPAPLSWKRQSEPHNVAHKRSKEGSDRKVHPVAEEDCFKRENFVSRASSCNVGGQATVTVARHEGFTGERCEEEKIEKKIELDSLSIGKEGEEKSTERAVRKRPARLVIPEICAVSDFRKAGTEKNSGDVNAAVEVEGSGFCLASRKGHRHVMEDGYGVITNIHGNSKQAFFGVFDGHGGRAAVDFVSENLGNNIIAAVAHLEKEKEQRLEMAIKAGYLTTDREFLNQGVSSGACAATVLLKDGELHVANVGDCRVVMSRKGVANALTTDHRPGTEDEKNRIESSGGYVSCCNGVWRVQDSLAVSRAIGDINMKQWIISEPETKKLQLTRDCEFLIMASDGLWDKVTNQEAVDVVLRHNNNSMKSCKDLVDISRSRGGRDDITIMVVDLQKFLHL
ncbi:putative protein phosphatase 2C 77 [Ananas comosus]|uniref:protein-serine/threonine phosphatase n=1 Tax=Ananas comosus TaxID=4615 RepID=A0A199UG46_ANACO|nr:putative protein phosphatase 2C 77 [Ananas comosus]